MRGAQLNRGKLMGISFLIHLAVMADSLWGEIDRSYPPSWLRDLALVIMVLFVMSAGILFANKFFQTMLVWGYLAGALAIGVPLATNPGSYSLIYGFLAFMGRVSFSGGQSVLLALCSFLAPLALAFLGINLWSETTPRPVQPGSLLLFGTIWLLGLIVGDVVARWQAESVKAREALEDLEEANLAIANANIRLQEIAVNCETETVTKERTRLAREIHDTIAYTLTNLLSFLDAYREKLQNEGIGVPTEIVQARALTRDGFADVRQVLHGLRAKDKEAESGLGNIYHLAKVFSEATAINVKLNYGDAPQFPGSKIEDTFYRVAQEGLTNAFRHGRATEVFITFHRWKGGIEMTVSDNGRGADETSTAGGFGLLGIRERAEALGGSMTAIAQPGLGFTLRVWLPCADGRDREEGSHENSDCRRSEVVSPKPEDRDRTAHARCRGGRHRW